MVKTKKTTQKVTKEMTIAEVLDKFPKTAPILLGLGLHCAGCPAAQQETIEDLAKVNQIDLKTLLENLNKSAE
jgi:hybrid cluster-associated redox disulfide protein